MTGSLWLIRVAMLVALVFGLMAVVAGLWFMAPVVLVIGLVVAIVQTRRIESR